MADAGSNQVWRWLRGRFMLGSQEGEGNAPARRACIVMFARFNRPGSVVGELSMIDGVPRSASVMALQDSKLSFISRAAFQAFGEARPELYRYLTTLLARRLRFTNDTVAATSFLSLKGRVARVLLSLAEEFGRDVGRGRVVIQQKVSQDDLAGMAGVARENVSRVLHDWTNHSVLSRLSGYYCLEDKAILKRAAKDYLVPRPRASLIKNKQ